MPDAGCYLRSIHCFAIGTDGSSEIGLAVDDGVISALCAREINAAKIGT